MNNITLGPAQNEYLQKQDASYDGEKFQLLYMA